MRGVGSTLAFSEFELDTARHELRRQGALQIVQPKVVSLLIYLAQHQGRTVPVAELLQNVWPEETVTASSVKRAICGARRALGEGANSQHSIRTIRGLGYRFVQTVEQGPQSGIVLRPFHTAGVPPEPFVGREAVLDLLGARLHQALQGPGELVLVSGEPGIGKSRTVHELGLRGTELGADVWTGRCLEEDGAPAFWPWIQVLRECVRARGPSDTLALLSSRAADIAEAIPELRGLLPDIAKAPAIDPKAARFRAFDGMTSFLRGASEARPIVLVLEDLHRADRDTLELLDFVTQQPSRAGLLLVGTIRRAGAREGTAELVRKVTRSRPATVIELVGLLPDDVARYTEAVVGSVAPPAVVAALHEQTAGNPLFCRQVLLRFRARLTSGTTPPWEDLTSATKYDGLLEATERHLEVVSADCRALLGAAAVLGREFSLGSLVQITDLAPATERCLVREAVDAGLVQPWPDGGDFRFTHALVRDVLYMALSEPERARLHGRAGFAIEARRSKLTDSELSEAAFHFHRAAPDYDEGRALLFAEKAADAAMARLAPQEALVHLERALGMLDLQAADPARRMRLLLTKGHALSHGDLEAARTELLEAFAIARRLGAVDMMVQVVVLYSGHSESGEVDGVRLDMLRETLEHLPADDPRQPMVNALLARTLCYAGRMEECARRVQEAIAGARLVESPSLRGEALHYCHQSLSQPEDLASRIEIADELSALAEKQGDSSLLLRACMAQIVSAVETGDMDSVDAAIATLDAVVQRAREPFFRWYAACARSMRAMVDGALDVAEARAREGLEIGKLLDPETAHHVHVAQVSGLWWLAGRVTEAEAMIRDLSSRLPGNAGWRAQLACVEVDLGRKEPARRALERLMRETGNDPRDTPFAMSVLAPLAELCGRIGEPAMARTLYEKLIPYARHHGFVASGIATHGPITRHLGLLAARMGESALALAHLRGSIEAAERMGSPSFTALCSLGYGRMLLAEESPEARQQAAAVLSKAMNLSKRAGMWGVAGRCEMIAERAGVELVRSVPPLCDVR
jgi:DNA-binding winged helix-turn-helix (wHTH) protein/tetratricopeptide (TPR) repeat protein